MWVKICANTNLEDALLAANLGADAVGFVFAPSTRQVTASQVRDITSKLPETLEKVGVFQSRSAEEIAEAAVFSGLTAVQLHNQFDRILTSRLRTLLPERIRMIQTAHWPLQVASADALRHVRGELRGIRAYSQDLPVLVDSKMGSSTSGGTGVAFAWGDAASLFASQNGIWMILAGGLRPENVAEAIHVLHPWGVDVASGVECEPGRKDPEKLKAFIENARSAV